MTETICGRCGGSGTVTITGANHVPERSPCPDCGTTAMQAVELKNDLPTIPLPPSGAVKLAFLTAIRYRGTTSAIRAYNSALSAVYQTKQIRNQLLESNIETERIIRTLKEVEDIHKADSARRKADLARAVNDQERAEFELAQERAIRQMKLDELTNARAPNRSKDEEEFLEALKASLKPADYERLTEDYINEAGFQGDGAEVIRKRSKEIIDDTFS